jgi:hypothetical protein
VLLRASDSFQDLATSVIKLDHAAATVQELSVPEENCAEPPKAALCWHCKSQRQDGCKASAPATLYSSS